jgi:hypothetical protein
LKRTRDERAEYVRCNPARLAQRLPLAAEIVIARIRDSRSSADAVDMPARRNIRISRSWARSWPRMRVISLRTQSSLAGLTARSGPRAVAGFPYDLGVAELAAGGRLNASAPAQPVFRKSASARVMAALALVHSTASPSARPSSAKTKGSAT